jgi:hypothetical protein
MLSLQKWSMKNEKRVYFIIHLVPSRSAKAILPTSSISCFPDESFEKRLGTTDMLKLTRRRGKR